MKNQSAKVLTNLCSVDTSLSNFIVHALPRSRTSWLASFLSYKDHDCGHEVAMTFRGPGDIIDYFQPNVGASETGAAQGWWLVHHAVPNIKTVVIKRPVQEVVDSLLSVDLTGVAQYDEGLLFKHMSYGDRILSDISARPETLTVEFKDLKNFEACEAIFEHCLPYRFDVKWWSSLKNQNIQVSVRDKLRYYHMHKTEIDNFKKLCKRELIHLRRTDPNNPLWKKAA